VTQKSSNSKYFLDNQIMDFTELLKDISNDRPFNETYALVKKLSDPKYFDTDESGLTEKQLADLEKAKRFAISNEGRILT